jgi:hypothetical protein
MDLTKPTANSLIQHLIGKSPTYNAPSKYYFALSEATVDKTTDFSSLVELTTRLEITNNTSNFTFTDTGGAGDVGTVSNTDAWIFPAGWATVGAGVQSIVAFDALTNGDAIFFTNFASTTTVTAGDVFLIAPGGAEFKFE